MNVYISKRRRWRHHLLNLGIFFFLWLYDNVAAESTSKPVDRKCRTVLGQSVYYCSEHEFSLFASISCYQYMPPYVIPTDVKWRIRPAKAPCKIDVLKPINSSKVFIIALPEEYDINNETSAIYSTFQKERDKLLWRECHSAALKCCETMLSVNRSPNSTDCPRTWDGWQCFEDTPAGGVTEADCPNHMYFRSEPPACPKKLQKQCLPEGYSWAPYQKNSTGEWTNYTVCQDKQSILVRHYVHVASFMVSLVALAPAIFIFFIYKQLRVPRIAMHTNLFISIFINGVVFIVFKWIIIIRELTKDDADTYSIVYENTGGCKFLFMLTKYTRATNYMWMLCEGFYLHKLIVAAFAEQKNLILYYVIGWGFPVIPVIIYSIIRVLTVDSRCWTFPLEGYEWIINGPNLLSLMINFLFLCNIIRVLVTKLRASHTNEPSQYRKAVRATLVLIPLFGLHFFVTIYRPSSGPCEFTEAYFYINYVIDGLQGFLVALMFCYLNGEVCYVTHEFYSGMIMGALQNMAIKMGVLENQVLQLIRRSIYRWKIQHNKMSSRCSLSTHVSSVENSSIFSGQKIRNLELKSDNYEKNKSVE